MFITLERVEKYTKDVSQANTDIITKNIGLLVRDPHEQAFTQTARTMSILNPEYLQDELAQRELRDLLRLIGPDKIPEVYDRILKGVPKVLGDYFHLTMPNSYTGDRARWQNSDPTITTAELDIKEINLFRYGILPVNKAIRDRLINKIIGQSSPQHKAIFNLNGEQALTKDGIIQYTKITLTNVLARKSQEDLYNWPEDLIQKVVQFYITSLTDSRNNSIDDIVSIQQSLTQYNTTAQDNLYRRNPADSNAQSNPHNLLGSCHLENSFASEVETALSDQQDKEKLAMMATRDHQEGLLNGLGFQKKVLGEFRHIITQIQSNTVGIDQLDCVGVLSLDTAALKSFNDLLGDTTGNGLLRYTADCLMWLTQDPVIIDGVSVTFKHAAAVGGDEFRMFYESSRPLAARDVSLLVTSLLQRLYLDAKKIYDTPVPSSNQDALDHRKNLNLPAYIKPFDKYHNILFAVPLTDGAQAFIDFFGGGGSQGWDSAQKKAKSAGISDLRSELDKIHHAYTSSVGQYQPDTSCVNTRVINGTVTHETVTHVDNGFSFFNAVGACTLSEVLKKTKPDDLTNCGGDSMLQILKDMNASADWMANIFKADLKNDLKTRSLLLKLLYSFRVEESLTSSEIINVFLIRAKTFQDEMIDSSNVTEVSALVDEYKTKLPQIQKKAISELLQGSGIVERRGPKKSAYSLLPQSSLIEGAHNTRRSLQLTEQVFENLKDKINTYYTSLIVSA